MKKTASMLSIIVSGFLLVGCGGFSDSDTSSSSSIPTSSLTTTYRIAGTNQSLCYDSQTGATTTCTEGLNGYHKGNISNYTQTTVNGETMTTDNVTSLVWQTTSNSTKLTPADGANYCSALHYAGYDDWRLPSIKELYSLIEFSGVDMSGVPGATTAGQSVNTTGYAPFIDSANFDVLYGDTEGGERIIDAQYNTATNYVSKTMNNESAMFGVNFIDGRIKGYPQQQTYYTRCVRGNTDYGVN